MAQHQQHQHQQQVLVEDPNWDGVPKWDKEPQVSSKHLAFLDANVAASTFVVFSCTPLRTFG